MGEGMPWGIIMIFFFLGVLLGIRTEINMRKKANENIKQSRGKL